MDTMPTAPAPPAPDSRRGTVGCWALAALFAASGSMHFIAPEPFVEIVPAALPNPELLVALSGAAEIAGAIGLLIPRTRRAAGIGLLLLLVAVFPANVAMFVAPDRYGMGAPRWLLAARLPLQPLLMWFVWLAAVRRPPVRHHD